MLLNVEHRTNYFYSEEIGYGVQQIRMRPFLNNQQRAVSWQVSINGANEQFNFTDNLGNHVDLYTLSNTTELEIISKGKVETFENNGVVGPHLSIIPLWYYKNSTPLTLAGPKIRTIARNWETRSTNSIETLHSLSAKIRKLVGYELGHTNSTTTAEQAVNIGFGVCQDHTHIFISAARLLGYPARYVSGHLFSSETKSISASHAWAEAFLDSIGWIGFDISNGISPDERYIKIAVGLDYQKAAPVRGIRYGDTDERVETHVFVEQ